MLVCSMELAINLCFIVFYSIHVLGKIVMMLELFRDCQKKEKLAAVIEDLTDEIKGQTNKRCWAIRDFSSSLAFSLWHPLFCLGAEGGKRRTFEMKVIWSVDTPGGAWLVCW